jgi:prophage regulatory protein
MSGAKGKERYLSLKEVRQRTGLGRTTIYSNMARGEFPPRYQLTAGRIGWKESDIERWIATRRPPKFGAHRGKKVVSLPPAEGEARGLKRAI